jgi:hypothetical protein
LILVPSLIFDQGDRYIEMALPLWTAAYALAISNLIPEISRFVARRRAMAGARSTAPSR